MAVLGLAIDDREDDVGKGLLVGDGGVEQALVDEEFVGRGYDGPESGAPDEEDLLEGRDRKEGLSRRDVGAEIAVLPVVADDDVALGDLAYVDLAEARDLGLALPAGAELFLDAFEPGDRVVDDGREVGAHLFEPRVESLHLCAGLLDVVE